MVKLSDFYRNAAYRIMCGMDLCCCIAIENAFWDWFCETPGASTYYLHRAKSLFMDWFFVSIGLRYSYNFWWDPEDTESRLIALHLMAYIAELAKNETPDSIPSL